jgi:hypothetical protein
MHTFLISRRAPISILGVTRNLNFKYIMLLNAKDLTKEGILALYVPDMHTLEFSK